MNLGTVIDTKSISTLVQAAMRHPAGVWSWVTNGDSVDVTIAATSIYEGSKDVEVTFSIPRAVAEYNEGA